MTEFVPWVFGSEREQALARMDRARELLASADALRDQGDETLARAHELNLELEVVEEAESDGPEYPSEAYWRNGVNPGVDNLYGGTAWR